MIHESRRFRGYEDQELVFHALDLISYTYWAVYTRSHTHGGGNPRGTHLLDGLMRIIREIIRGENGKRRERRGSGIKSTYSPHYPCSNYYFDVRPFGLPLLCSAAEIG